VKPNLKTMFSLRISSLRTLIQTYRSDGPTKSTWGRFYETIVSTKENSHKYAHESLDFTCLLRPSSQESSIVRQRRAKVRLVYESKRWSVPKFMDQGYLLDQASQLDLIKIFDFSKKIRWNQNHLDYLHPLALPTMTRQLRYRRQWRPHDSAPHTRVPPR